MSSRLTQTFRQVSGDPLRLVAALWSLVLPLPFIDGLPRVNLGLPFRQELALSFILSLTLGLILKRMFTVRISDLRFSSIELSVLFAGAIFALWNTLSAVWSTHVANALQHGLAWSVFIVFLALMMCVVRNPRKLRLTLRVLGVVIWMLSVACIIESIAGGTWTDHSVRLNENPLLRGFGGFAEMLAVAVPLFAGLALHVRRKTQAILCGATSLVAWSSILFVFERAPAIGAMTGTLLVFACATLLRREHRGRNAKRVGVLILAFFLVTFAQEISLKATGEGASAVTRLRATDATDYSTQVRMLLWGAAWQMTRDNPVIGVGAGNYEAQFPEARREFAATRTNNPLVGLVEDRVVERAHNEYLQIAAELGAVGLLLFIFFACALVRAFWLALRRTQFALPVLGAGGGLCAFVLSAGASSFGFHWTGGSLIFFFAAAVVTSQAAKHAKPSSIVERRDTAFTDWSSVNLSIVRRGALCGLILTLVMLAGAATRGVSVMYHAAAQANSDAAQADTLYRRALWFAPYDTSTHFNYGMRLYYQKRAAEAVPHLRYATRRGLHASVCFASQAAAEVDAGDARAALDTLAYAVAVYPQSLYLRASYGARLEAEEDDKAAQIQYVAATRIDPAAAEVWWRFVHSGVDAAEATARHDGTLTKPGDLQPQAAVHALLAQQRLHGLSPRILTSGKNIQ
ncbi:MAG: O-antigen ligase family protein [Pyrinomonadaceae bacterium MAG19_C2-C3]|nr:O-antigen ligase family protein [Pyrinomonadaceae bacterium MAG19_C2-C3]